MPQQPSNVKTYEFTDPQTGRTIEIDGPAPPPEAVIRQMFAQLEPPTDRAETPQMRAAPSFLTDPNRNVLAAAAQGIIGGAKGVGSTVFGLGKMVHDYTPIGALSDAIAPGAFDEKPEILKPSNPQQQTGYLAEQIGEFFTPLGLSGKAAKVGEVLKAGALTQAQTGSPVAAGVSAALSAVPLGGALQKGSQMLQEGAEATMAKALGPTKEWAKDKAAKLAPQMLERGVRGTREQMLARAKAASERVGARIGALYKEAAGEGAAISGNIIRGDLQFAKDAFMVPAANGQMIPIHGAESVIKELDALDDFVAKLGDHIPVDQAARIKTTWGRIVNKSGLFGQKSGASATDNATAWSVREGTGAFTKLLNDVHPDIAALNAEYAFQTGLRDVLKATQKRTQSQAGTGLVAAGSSGTGALIGAAQGDTMSERGFNAIVGAAAGRQFVRLLQSPYWRTAVSGPLKQQMARALATGSRGEINSVTHRILVSLPAQARQALAQ